MSLAIEVDDVTQLLLADGWHTVDDASFESTLTSSGGMKAWTTARVLEVVKTSTSRQQGHRGSTAREHIAAAGFSFTEGAHVLCGPLTSVLAVKIKTKRQHSTPDIQR